MFAVEGCGSIDDHSETEVKSLLLDFLIFIKANKVVLMEDLATHFQLKTKDAIARLRSLEASGDLSGFLDDRGKYVYVTSAELDNVATWIKQRGRVCISDLVEHSNQLIKLDVL